MSLPSDDLVESLNVLARRGDVRALIDLLNRAEDIRLSADAIEAAQRDLYWKHQEVSAMVALSRAGISYLLEAAEEMIDDEVSRLAGNAAKALAYNLASFTWPGWDEPGILLNDSDLAVGLEAAELNLRLAEEQDRPDKAKANACWVLGAHYLAVGEYDLAMKTFGTGKDYAIRSEDEALAKMIEGYRLLSRVLEEPQDVELRREYEEGVADLKTMDSEDAREYARQLATAFSVFGGDQSPTG